MIVTVYVLILVYTSHGVCVNATKHEYPLEAKGASLSPEGVDNTKEVATLSKAAEQEGIMDFKEINTRGIAIANNPELPELDTDPEGSGELLGIQCWEAQEEKPGSKIQHSSI